MLGDYKKEIEESKDKPFFRVDTHKKISISQLRTPRFFHFFGNKPLQVAKAHQENQQRFLAELKAEIKDAPITAREQEAAFYGGLIPGLVAEYMENNQTDEVESKSSENSLTPRFLGKDKLSILEFLEISAEQMTVEDGCLDYKILIQSILKDMKKKIQTLKLPEEIDASSESTQSDLTKAHAEFIEYINFQINRLHQKLANNNERMLTRHYICFVVTGACIMQATLGGLAAKGRLKHDLNLDAADPAVWVVSTLISTAMAALAFFPFNSVFRGNATPEEERRLNVAKDDTLGCLSEHLLLNASGSRNQQIAKEVMDGLRIYRDQLRDSWPDKSKTQNCNST